MTKTDNLLNLEAERDFLSLLLNYPNTIIENSDKIYMDLMSDPFHKKILSKIKGNVLTDVPITLSAITGNSNEQQHLRDIFIRNISAEYFDTFYNILEECFICRSLKQIASDVGNKIEAEGVDVQSLVHNVRSSLDNLDEKKSTSIYKASDMIDSIIDNHEQMKIDVEDGKDILDGVVVQSPLQGLNDLLLTNGFSKGDFIVVAATPSTGKTELALNIASHASITEDKNVFIYSLEMDKESLVERILLEQSKVDSFNLMRGLITDSDLIKIKEGGKRIKDSGLIFEDNLSANLWDLIASIKKADNRYGLDMVIIDYLQLIDVPGKHDVQELTEITRVLKRESVRLKIPFLVLSQLSRTHLTEGREPDLRDLRGSGTIEQDADIVMFLYATNKEKKNTAFTKTKLILGKQRKGPIGEIYLENNKAIQTFTEVSQAKFGIRKTHDNPDNEVNDLPF
jgi:replicative DNA helicase